MTISVNFDFDPATNRITNLRCAVAEGDQAAAPAAGRRRSNLKNHERRCAGVLVANMKKNRAYTNLEMGALLDLNGEKRTSLGATIKFMRDEGMITSDRRGVHRRAA